MRKDSRSDRGLLGVLEEVFRLEMQTWVSWGATSVSLRLRNPEEGLRGVLSFVEELWGAREVTLKRTQKPLGRCSFAWRRWEAEKQEMKSQGHQ